MITDLKKYAVITGASGGMGYEITKEVAKAGYHVIMACFTHEKAEKKRAQIIQETGNRDIEIEYLNLASFKTVKAFSERLHQKQIQIDLLMNNAGTMPEKRILTEDNIEYTVSVNYASPFLLTHLLLDLMNTNSRIVNMISCTYKIGKLNHDYFMTQGKKGKFDRIAIYSNSKLALSLFTMSFAEKYKNKGITINGADPGIVNTPIIRMNKWFDPLTDIFYRPFIRTPRQGADTAIELLLNDKYQNCNGQLFVNRKAIKVKPKIANHPDKVWLWNKTKEILKPYLEK